MTLEERIEKLEERVEKLEARLKGKYRREFDHHPQNCAVR